MSRGFSFTGRRVRCPPLIRLMSPTYVTRYVKRQRQSDTLDPFS